MVMGGGPTLVRDMSAGPPDAVRIMVNIHAAIAGVDADYMVLTDHGSGLDLETVPAGVVVISHSAQADIRLGQNVPDFGFTSGNATWVAQILGCSPVVLAGMDCYQDPRGYCHDFRLQPNAAGFAAVIDRGRSRLDDSLARWRRVRDAAWNPADIYAVSGPLVDAAVFPAWGDVGSF